MKTVPYRDNHAVAFPNGTAAAIESDHEDDGSDDDQSYGGPRNIHILQMFVNFVDVRIRQCASYQDGQTT